MKVTSVFLVMSFLEASVAWAAASNIIDQNLIAEHQRCVLRSFEEQVKRANQFDPDLLHKSVAKCEPLLEATRRKIMELTKDAAFAEKALAKIRKASMHGVAATVLVHFGNLDQRSP
jgi:hypothetical protein